MWTQVVCGAGLNLRKNEDEEEEGSLRQRINDKESGLGRVPPGDLLSDEMMPVP